MAGPDDLAAARRFIETEAERAGVSADPAMDPAAQVWIARQLVYLLQIAPAEPGTKVRLQTRPT
jgi:hypothetical protein